VRADKVHHEDADAESGARTGPRHAAPRKPLFTRWQMPAGKAIALAAMPTAVLMGMGLTPTLAQAKPMPKNPFQDGPCVTQPDETPKDDSSADPGKDKKGAEDGKDASGKDGKDQASPSPSASTSPSATPSPSASPRAPQSTKASPSPSATGGDQASGGLLGGLGSVLGGILDPGGQQKASASASPSPSASGGDSAAGTAAGAVGDTVDRVTGAAKDTAGKAVDDAKDTADEAEDAASPTPSATDPMAPDENGKKPFPCVVEKKSDGTSETPPAVIPNQPWKLEASSLLLQGLDYTGVVNLTMPNGQTKQALKFTADSVDIGDLHQIVEGPGGSHYHVEAAKGSTSTIRGGKVTLYTESLKGNLFGLIPITFDPEHPPPINVPIAYFTNVKLAQAGQFGGNLTIPGLHNYIED
jgi:hypothetical protein